MRTDGAVPGNTVVFDSSDLALLTHPMPLTQRLACPLAINPPNSPKVFSGTMPHAPDNTNDILRTGIETTMGREIAEIETLKSSGRQSSSIRFTRVTFVDQGTLHVWAKTLHGTRNSKIMQARTARDFDLHTLLHAAFQGQGRFRVPRPIFHWPEERLIVTEHCDGYRLQDKIERLARGFPRSERIRELQQDCRLTGQWLRAFQSATRDHAPGVAGGFEAQKLKDPARIMELTSTRIGELLARSPNALGNLKRGHVLAFLDDALGSIDPHEAASCSIHGDFFPGNLLVGPDHVCGIDFSSATWGTPWFDPSYYVFQLETMATKPWFRKRTLSKLIDAFLEGYGSHLRHRDFWYATPGMEILHVSHCIARLLALSKNAQEKGPRALYRKHLMRGIIKTLSSHRQRQV